MFKTFTLEHSDEVRKIFTDNPHLLKTPGWENIWKIHHAFLRMAYGVVESWMIYHGEMVTVDPRCAKEHDCLREIMARSRRIVATISLWDDEGFDSMQPRPMWHYEVRVFHDEEDEEPQAIEGVLAEMETGHMRYGHRLVTVD